MPDELLETAANGSLMTEAWYTAQVERLFSDPRAEDSVNDFYRDFFRVHFRYQQGPNGGRHCSLSCSGSVESFHSCES